MCLTGASLLLRYDLIKTFGIGSLSIHSVFEN